jgi:hypothetical protein
MTASGQRGSSVVADGDELDFNYTGLHAFGFLTGGAAPPSEVMDRIRELGRPPAGPVIWSGTFVGDYLGLVHARVESLGELQDLIEGPFWERGMRGRWAIERRVAERKDGTRSVRVGVKRATPEFIAVSSVTVERDRLSEVIAAVVDIPTVRGASVVFGQADLLVQLGGDDFESVATSVEDDLQKVAGILHTATAFSDGRR